MHSVICNADINGVNFNDIKWDTVHENNIENYVTLLGTQQNKRKEKYKGRKYTKIFTVVFCEGFMCDFILIFIFPY